jgi:hypothetical protein
MGASAASASTTDPTSDDQAQASCWMDATTGQSLCVPDGVDLVAAVEADTGVVIDIPEGTVVGGVETSSAQAKLGLLSINAATTTKIVSAIYDDINYGGGTYVMTASGAGCDWGISNLGNFGWNDRASSFKSYSGCKTALYKNINFGSTKIGFATNEASFGSMNDQGSSWATE